MSFETELETRRISRDAAGATAESARISYIAMTAAYSSAQDEQQRAAGRYPGGHATLVAKETALATAKTNMDTAHTTWRNAIAAHQTAINVYDVFKASVFSYVG